MSRVDYYAITEEIKTILDASAHITSTPNIVVEDDVIFGTFDHTPQIMVYLTNRTPAPNQRIAAGRDTRYRLQFSIWVWCSGLGKQGVKDAINLRNDLLGQIELELMEKRTLNEMVDGLWLQGGDMTSIRPDKTRFVSGAELIIIAEVSATL